MNNGTFRLPAQAHIENVHLRVRSADESLKFYRELLGFREIRRLGKTVFLSASGSSPAQVVLTEHAGAKPRSRRSPGLFHTAILLPDRRGLAQIFTRLYERGYPFQGFADHGVSEALYLADPEGNGIELYADRPRDAWAYNNGELAMVTEELNLDNLVAELREETPWTGMHPDTRIGHVHLQVSDIAKAERFYHHLLGFDITQRSYSGALFVAAGGYHHHLGMNIWNSRGSAPALPDSLGLMSFRVQMAERGVLHELKKRLDDAHITLEDKGSTIRLTDDDGIVVELSEADETTN